MSAVESNAPRTDAPRPTTVVVTGASGWLGQNLVRALARDRERVRCLVPAADEAPLLEVVGPDGRGRRRRRARPGGARPRSSTASGRATRLPRRGGDPPAEARRASSSTSTSAAPQLVLDRARRARRRALRPRVVELAVRREPDRRPTGSPRTRRTTRTWATGSRSSKPSSSCSAATSAATSPTVIVRAPWFYGPYQPPRQTQFFAAVRTGRFPLVGDGTQRRSMVFTGNLVHGLLRAEATPRRPGPGLLDRRRRALRAARDPGTVRAALEAEGLPVSAGQPPHARASPAGRGSGSTRVLQSRGRYVQPLHVLGELKDTIACDISRAPRRARLRPADRACSRACGPASGGASSAATPSDDRRARSSSPAAAATSARSLADQALAPR